MPLSLLIIAILVGMLFVPVIIAMTVADAVYSVLKGARMKVAIFFAAISVSTLVMAAAAEPSNDTIGALLDILIAHFSSGAMSVTDWVILSVVVLHFVASAYVNLTDTPDDNSLYGKVYHYLVEPLAGVLIKHKVKQKPFSDIQLK